MSKCRNHWGHAQQHASSIAFAPDVWVRGQPNAGTKLQIQNSSGPSRQHRIMSPPASDFGVPSGPRVTSWTSCGVCRAIVDTALAAPTAHNSATPHQSMVHHDRIYVITGMQRRSFSTRASSSAGSFSRQCRAPTARYRNHGPKTMILSTDGTAMRCDAPHHAKRRRHEPE